ncbi:MAG: hypothetical protein K0A98_04480 [Trueperaceae bacterium]|nr:hypothetical protein [Trueperaceae bacterium]
MKTTGGPLPLTVAANLQPCGSTSNAGITPPHLDAVDHRSRHRASEPRETP